MDTENKTKNPADMEEEEMPDVRAFNDEFTRDFLQSTEETREGYYPFVSGSENFQFDFPAEGVIGEKAYVNKENGYEEFPIHIKGGTEETDSEIRINYYPGDGKESIDHSLDWLKNV